MGLSTDTGSFSAQVDFAKATSLASAATVDLGASNGNTVIILGTTTITSLGTAPQAGVKRTVKFNDALILTNGADLVLFGGANVTTVAGDIAEFTAMTTTTWEMTGWFRPTAYTGGQIGTSGILDASITAAKLANGAVSAAQSRPKAVTGLADADATLNDGELLDGLFVIAPSATRTLTTDTALNIIATLPGYQIGSSYEFTIVNTAAFNAVLAGGAGVSIIGSATINNTSGTFLVTVTAPTTVSIYRK